MLKHEPAEITTPTAAEARVTPEELNAALKTLEDQQASTVAIGSVVDELRLNATPEQIWEQVQKHRQQPPQAPKAVVFTPTNAPARRRLRSWREIKGWTWVLFWCTGGIGWFTLSPLLHHAGPPGQTITVSGDSMHEAISVQGKDVIISGDNDTIMLTGQARSVTVSGDGDKMRGDEPKVSDVTGDGADVQWNREPHPVAPRPPSPS